MADRFPSLEEFDSGAQTTVENAGDDASSQDFLAREKALLGEDADQFATTADGDAFAEADDDLLGAPDAAPSSAFDSQFPDLADPMAGLAGAPEPTSITGPSVTYSSGFFPPAGTHDEEEPEVIKQWRSRRDAQIAKRAEQFAAQREDIIKDAQQNIDDFYENYNAKKEKGIAQARKEAEEFLAGREDTVSGGTSWDRIARLVDVTGKGNKGGAAGSGKERFREMLMGLRGDEKAPGATGY